MKRLLSAAAVLAATTSVSAARADETSLEGLLAEEVVTSVSKTVEAASNAPALTRSISAEDMRRYGMTSVSEALDFLGVGVQSQHILGRSDLTVRGVAFAGDRGSHVLVLVDGHAVNEPLFGDAALDQRLGVPLELIDHVELVLGPGSAIYGTSAVLAVVNVVTKTAEAHAGVHAVAELSSSLTLRTTLTAGHTFDLFGKRTGVTTGLQFYDRNSTVDFTRQDLGRDPFTGARTSWGGRATSADRLDIPALHVGLVRDRLRVTARAVLADAGDPTGIGDFDHPAAGNVERRASIAIDDSFALGRVVELSASVYGTVYLNRKRILSARRIQCPLLGITCDSRENEASNRIGVETRATFDWLKSGRFVTAVGTSASLDHVSGSIDYSAFERPIVLLPSTRTLDIGSVVNVSANGQQTFVVARWLELNAGARLDWRKLNDEGGHTYTFDPVVTPRLGATARPWTGATTKLIYANAFRAPNPYELDAQSILLLRSAGLQPERVSSIEAIQEQRIDSHRFTLGVFRSVYRGLIGRTNLTARETQDAIARGLTILSAADPNSPLSQYRADDETTTQGFNAGIDGGALAQRLRWGASVTGAIARTEGDQRVPLAPQAFGNARISYDLGGTLPVVALATTFAGSTLSDRGNDVGFTRGTLAPPSLELRGTLTGAIPWFKGLSYRASVAHQLHDRTAYAVGPTLRGGPGIEAPFLAPSQRWNAFVGLQYDFGR